MTEFVPTPTHPFEDLYQDSDGVWVFRNQRMVHGDTGEPFGFDAVNLHRRMIVGDELAPPQWLGICRWCVHQMGHPNALTCDAFPVEIPDLIRRGDFDHRDPYPGDNGITFAPRPGITITPEMFASALPSLDVGANPVERDDRCD